MQLVLLFPLLLASYGVCFGLMNDKASWFTDPLRKLRFRVQKVEETETTFFERMLHCPYCTGFHTGWMSWVVSLGVVGLWVPVGGSVIYGIIGNVVCVGLFAFSSAAFCYLVDTGAQRLER